MHTTHSGRPTITSEELGAPTTGTYLALRRVGCAFLHVESS